MSLLSDNDRKKRQPFLQYAASADAMALNTHDLKDRGTWEHIALSYRELATALKRKFTL